MFADEALLDNQINEAIVTQLPELRMSLSLGDSELLTKLVREIAQSSNVPIVSSLVGVCGQQHSFFSMDNALLISHTLTPRRAWTVVALKIPTHRLATLIQLGDDLYSLEKEKDICRLSGGFPRRSGRRLLGGISISGGSAKGGMLIAHQAMARFSVLRCPLITTRQFLAVHLKGRHVFNLYIND